MPVENGNKVQIEYCGTLEDGTVFDDSKNHGKPLEFEVGTKQVIPGFENAVLGMEKDEEKEVSIEPKEAYGEYNDQLIKDIPRTQLPQDQEPKEGMMLMMGMPNGQQMPAKITKVTEERVTLDLNHPLAGKKLNFKIKLVDFS